MENHPDGGKGQDTGARPKVYSRPQTHAKRNKDTDVTECTKEEASEHYKTRRNVTTRGKTFCGKVLGRKSLGKA